MINRSCPSCNSLPGQWAEALRNYFMEIGMDGTATVHEVATGMALYCGEQNRPLPAHVLPLLAARSFYASGDVETAQQVLLHDRRCSPHATLWMDAITSDRAFYELYPLFAARALRPQSLRAWGSLWVLDFMRIGIAEENGHEMILFRTVKSLAERLCGLWEKSCGYGTLGLKGLSSRALRIGLRQMPGRMRDDFQAVFNLSAARHGWPVAPSVLRLD